MHEPHQIPKLGTKNEVELRAEFVNTRHLTEVSESELVPEGRQQC